jgi:hypothetical protein
MVQACIVRRRGDRVAQQALAFVIAPELPVEIGEIDRSRGKLRIEPQRRLVLRLGLARLPAPRVIICQRGARFRPIGVEPLRGD